MDMLDIGRGILAAQPFSRLLGAELTAFSEGHAEIVVPLGEDLHQQNGFAHGGVLAYLADNAMTFAAGSLLKDVLTSEMKINYLRPGVGARLIARAQVLSHGRTQAVTRCDIFAFSETRGELLCAAAQGTVLRKPADKRPEERAS